MSAGNAPFTFSCSGTIPANRFVNVNHLTGVVTLPDTAAVPARPANGISVQDSFNGAVAIVSINDVNHSYFIQMAADVAKGEGIKAQNETGLGIIDNDEADLLRRAAYATKNGALVATYKI